MKPAQRRPAAFRLDDVSTIAADYVPGIGAPPVLTPEADAFAETAAAAGRRSLPRRRVRWTRLLIAGLGGLIALAIGLAIDTLIRDLFARNDWPRLAGGRRSPPSPASPCSPSPSARSPACSASGAITVIHAGAVEAVGRRRPRTQRDGSRAS